MIFRFQNLKPQTGHALREGLQESSARRALRGGERHFPKRDLRSAE